MRSYLDLVTAHAHDMRHGPKYDGYDCHFISADEIHGSQSYSWPFSTNKQTSAATRTSGNWIGAGCCIVP